MNQTELYVVITKDCSVCGKKVDGFNYGRKMGYDYAKAKDIHTGKYVAPHNTIHCGFANAEITTEAFDVPNGCLFGWDEVNG